MLNLKLKKMREKLIKAIYEMARDEFETTDDVLKLALKTDEQLVDELINLAGYFKSNDFRNNYD